MGSAFGYGGPLLRHQSISAACSSRPFACCSSAASCSGGYATGAFSADCRVGGGLAPSTSYTSLLLSQRGFSQSQHFAPGRHRFSTQAAQTGPPPPSTEKQPRSSYSPLHHNVEEFCQRIVPSEDEKKIKQSVIEGCAAANQSDDSNFKLSTIATPSMQLFCQV